MPVCRFRFDRNLHADRYEKKELHHSLIHYLVAFIHADLLEYQVRLVTDYLFASFVRQQWGHMEQVDTVHLLATVIVTVPGVDKLADLDLRSVAKDCIQVEVKASSSTPWEVVYYSSGNSLTCC